MYGLTEAFRSTYLAPEDIDRKPTSIGKAIPEWKGNLLLGSMAKTALIRLELDGDRVVHEERLLAARQDRIRDVREGPDGAIYLLVDADKGKLLRIRPAR